MHLTRDELQDKIFELEMEFKELLGEGGVAFLYENQEQLENLLEENQCWRDYYQQLLQELEQGE